MPAGARDAFQHKGAQFVGQLFERAPVERTQRGGIVNRFKQWIFSHGLECFSARLHKERARRQYGDRCARSRFRRAQRDGCDPAAIPNTENAEATQGKPLKNALETSACHIVALDYGIKFNTLRMLAQRGCRVTILPAVATAADVLAHAP